MVTEKPGRSSYSDHSYKRDAYKFFHLFQGCFSQFLLLTGHHWGLLLGKAAGRVGSFFHDSHGMGFCSCQPGIVSLSQYKV